MSEPTRQPAEEIIRQRLARGEYRPAFERVVELYSQKTQLPVALDHLGYAFAIVLAAFFAGRLFPWLWTTWVHYFQSSLWQVPIGLGVGALVFLAALGFIAKRPLARLLASL